ncbi:MAG: AhpC/TSA family protein [Bacteroidota bacterium]|nr:AhpC/TSA family protein [Bacteroidota bacterium]
MLILISICSISFAQQDSKVAASAEFINPVKTGEKIPSVNLRNIKGAVVSLDSIVSSAPTVLIFYRGGWCPFCNVQLSGLQKIENDIINLGYQIIAVSKDKPEMLSATIDSNQINYTLLSDNEGSAAKEFGIAFKVSDEYITKLKNYNIDLESSSGTTDHILPVPAVFILDTSGNIKYEYINPDYKIRLDTEVLLENIKSLAK